MVDFSKLKNLPSIIRAPLQEKGVGKERDFNPWRFSVEGQNFDFTQGKVLINGQDLAKHLGGNLHLLGSGYWGTLAKRLGLYRDWATLHVEDSAALGKFIALLHAFLTKIYGRIKKKYDETIDGVGFHLEDGQLLINGVNVNACLKMAKKRRSKKSRIFLKGLRGRLAILQENRMGNTSYEKIRDTVDRLALEIDEEIKAHPEIIELPPPNRQLPAP